MHLKYIFISLKKNFNKYTEFKIKNRNSIISDKIPFKSNLI